MKFIKYLIIPLVLVLVLAFASFQYFNEPLPKTTSSAGADELAKKILIAVSNDKWKETGALKWEFLVGSKYHKHIWDKNRHFAQVEFDHNIVQVDINNRRGRVLNKSKDLSQLDQMDLCEKAWKLWANDSFWLNPISKIFDLGTSRSIIEQGNGTNALLVTYSSGGVTPGDSYLWLLDDKDKPVAWKMWVSIIPIGGLQFSWDGWTELSTGAMISTVHHGLVDISINNVIGKKTLDQLTGRKDIFFGLEKSSIQF